MRSFAKARVASIRSVTSRSVDSAKRWLKRTMMHVKTPAMRSTLIQKTPRRGIVRGMDGSLTILFVFLLRFVFVFLLEVGVVSVCLSVLWTSS